MTIDGQAEAPKTTRLYQLEAARGFAAIYVFAHHYARRSGWHIKYILSFSTAAVMTFFLISGFVVYLSSGTTRHPFSISDYARKRSLRILPAYLCAMVLAFITRAIYANNTLIEPIVLIKNLAFLVESPDVRGAYPYANNFPVWSLSYEIWFYIFFAVLVATRGPKFETLRRDALLISLVGFVSVWIIPNPISQYAVLFVIWWAGAELAHEYERTGDISFRGQLRSLSTIAAMGVLTGGRFAAEHFTPLLRGSSPYRRTQAVELLIAGLIIVVALLWRRVGMIGFDYSIGLFLVFAPISYGIYLFHYPIIQLSVDPSFGGGAVWGALWVIPTVLILSWVFDLRLHRMLVGRLRRRATN